MAKFEGNILKMRTILASPVTYFLKVGSDEINMNELIGTKINMQFFGQINCISCGKITKTSFQQGFCYNCLQKAPEAGESVIRPELSKSQFGIARNLEWAEKNDLIDHIVYLAVSSELKVGVTRIHQIPTRWIDQGAGFAIKIAQTPNRHIAGIIEIFLKKHYTDRTNWQAMLKCSDVNNFDLREEKIKALNLLPAELQKYACADNAVTPIKYPLKEPLLKAKSISFDKMPQVHKILKGIKGQYLIFDDYMVLNVRKHNGYFLHVSF